MNTEHTPGPWRVGNGSFVIADNPAPGIMGSDDVAYYGGHLICESANKANARLIAAAPELLEALERICELPVTCRCDVRSDMLEAYDQAVAAITKARGTTHT